ncbi:hypothetical protein BDN71DRAFT_1448848 [Pleurotus eryngii]|uniref:Uncharacterized protein n=1 Tax=Pleurotus eryngii TaxID=5323 RepID=A0A9P5ZU20_PLEER|nr:hypothetical protein BDN71DRAFT_1448848 [Pleurotus eryngii]
MLPPPSTASSSSSKPTSSPPSPLPESLTSPSATPATITSPLHPPTSHSCPVYNPAVPPTPPQSSVFTSDLSFPPSFPFHVLLLSRHLWTPSSHFSLLDNTHPFLLLFWPFAVLLRSLHTGPFQPRRSFPFLCCRIPRPPLSQH